MNITYQNTTDGIEESHLNGFFCGWKERLTPKNHLTLLNRSTYRILAVNQETGNVVGFSTAITDGVLAAYLPLLEVLPEFQGKGIGKELVMRMVAALNEYYMVDIICDPEVQPFYEKLGFEKASGVMLRNYAHQGGRKLV